MRLTPTHQRNAVSEGMALGLIMCGQSTLPANKMDIDLSFEGAWRMWSYRDQFPQVTTDIRNGSGGSQIMTHADERKHTFNFYWGTDGPETAIYPRDLWSDSEIDFNEAAQLIDGDVPADGWSGLATEFLRRLKK